MELQNDVKNKGGKDKWDHEKEKEEKRGRNIFTNKSLDKQR